MKNKKKLDHSVTVVLEKLRTSAGLTQTEVGNKFQKDDGDQQQDKSHHAVQGGGQHLTSMLVVELGPRRQFGPVLGFQSLLAIPPGAPAVQVISNIRGADDRHSSPFRVEKESIAQIFYFEAPALRLHRVPFANLTRAVVCEIFPTPNEKTFLEKFPWGKIIRVEDVTFSK
jgi:hypothetical protein